MDKKDEKQQYEDSIRDDLRYLELLSHSYPTIADASTEIINLEAILNLPKPTEHFISDPHGESDAFNHVLRNASGYVKRKVNELFGDQLDESDKRELCTLIYYPEQKLQLLKLEKRDMHDFYRTSLVRLISVCREVSSKYTRSKIRKELPKDFEYIIEELLHESYSGYGEKKHKYYQMIVESIIDTGRADAFITEISKLIQRLAIDRLHLLGDIYDRGPGADKIMDTLCDYKHFDIVWGNHDIEWMGACAGNRACICNVLRLCMRYGNLSTLEDGYGINLLPLATFAMDTYRDDPCTEFEVRDLLKDGSLDEQTMRMLTQMHKAITIIQLKEEARIIDRRPSFGMTDRKLLDAIDLERRHIDCLLSRGGMYRVCNSNLMFHGSVPLDKDGQLKEVEVEGKQYKGKELMRKIERVVRNAFNSEVSSDRRRFSVDYLWYLWCGKDSPLFDKDKMATFERYFVADSKTHKEKKGYYYEYNNDEATIDMILDDFEVEGTHRHIINGHVPVKTTRGETPVKANGKLLVIDGGFSKAYQPETGIAGYTLIFHSRGLELMQHQPFRSAEEAVKRGDDIKSSVQIVEMSEHRMYVKDTDKGKVLQSKVENLKKLLYAYRNGLLN